MGKYDKPGYPLPDGDVSEDDMACTIVYYPDRPEYRQALVSSLLYLGNWLAWERDADKRGSDAAASWKIANELTLECLYMSCFEELQANVAAILAILQQQVQCCDENSTTGGSSEHETEIEPGVGDPPDYYGETEVADWDEWAEYLCHNAHLWVDELILQAGNWEVYLSTGGATVGLLASAIVAISFFVVGGVVSVPFLMLGFAGVVASMTGTLFSEAADDIETAREDIVCAIMNGSDLAAAVEEALGSGAAWDFFYTLIDYDSAAAILYEGGDGETYLESETRQDCDCEQRGEFLHTFDFDSETAEGWIYAVAGGYTAIGNPDHGIYYRRRTGHWLRLTSYNLRLEVGEGDPAALSWVKVHRIIIEWSQRTSNYSERMVVAGSDDEELENTVYPAWLSREFVYDPPLKFFKNNPVIELKAWTLDDGWAHFDNIVIDFDIGTDA